MSATGLRLDDWSHTERTQIERSRVMSWERVIESTPLQAILARDSIGYEGLAFALALSRARLDRVSTRPRLQAQSGEAPARGWGVSNPLTAPGSIALACAVFFQ